MLRKFTNLLYPPHPLPFASALESSHSQEVPAKVCDPNELRVKLFRTKELRAGFPPWFSLLIELDALPLLGRL
jgi:hypothetical protein